MYGMSKAYSASSNNSGASSETSETLSVEEAVPIAVDGDPNDVTPPPVSYNSRIPKSWKRMKDANNDKDKEAESKRPPWRAVSVSTLPKPDKNALLRAKLLDASRRLRAGKASVAVQTDIMPSKIMREVNLGTQPDLILYREVGILTDGCYTRKKQGADEFILTYSVSQMTDAVQSTSVATQTLLPKVVGDDFMRAYFNCDPKATNSYELSASERSLLDQIAKIRENKRLGTTFLSASNSSSNKHGSKPFLASGDNQTPAILSNARPSLLQPTMQSWHFEYGESGSENEAKFQPYTIYPSTRTRRSGNVSWPFQVRYGLDRSYIDATSLLLAMDDIIEESNYLVDIIEDLSAKNPAAIDTQAQTRISPERAPLLSEYWLPIIEEQEIELDKMLQALETPTLDKNEKYNV